jgi:hypothetical protein
VSQDLEGSIAQQPVNVAAAVTGQPAAVVVPLAAQVPSAQGMRLVGLVSFYVGCSGRAYFGSVTDITSLTAAAAQSFPAVGESAAAAQLDTSTPELVYTSSPFTPEWRNAESGASIAAGE